MIKKPDDNLSILTGWIRDTLTAARFLTRLPVPMAGVETERSLAEVVWSFPVIGLIVGAIGAAALMIATSAGLHPLASSLVALAAISLVTGALHEDGLADVADGFGGGAEISDKLRIMRDSTVGTYGVLVLVFSVAVRAAALAGMQGSGTAALALIAAAAVSRGLVAAAMAWMEPARTDGLGASAGRPEGEAALVALALSAVVVFVLLGSAGWAVLAAAVVAAAFMGWTANRQIGGHTGDVFGAVQQVAEIAALIAAAAVLG
ncbi:MAG: adenosylcobinamide-GDP ribazoletransferase [Rhodospirillaceae bacterium]|nr:adenosylcobinamide-GDP ribazoletransferase [Rhodospirillaceae bacterium]